MRKDFQHFTKLLRLLIRQVGFNQTAAILIQLFLKDPEREYSQLVRAMGGEVIHISATSQNHINAMDMTKDYGDGDVYKRQGIRRWLLRSR